jgi:hypothetical protein
MRGTQAPARPNRFLWDKPRTFFGKRGFLSKVPPRSRYNGAMPFVIKRKSRTGFDCWLSAPDHKGLRTLASREAAGLFQRYEEANLAIRKLPAAFKGVGRTFSVEPAD